MLALRGGASFVGRCDRDLGGLAACKLHVLELLGELLFLVFVLMVVRVTRTLQHHSCIMCTFCTDMYRHVFRYVSRHIYKSTTAAPLTCEWPNQQPVAKPTASGPTNSQCQQPASRDTLFFAPSSKPAEALTKFLSLLHFAPCRESELPTCDLTWQSTATDSSCLCVALLTRLEQQQRTASRFLNATFQPSDRARPNARAPAMSDQRSGH